MPILTGTKHDREQSAPASCPSPMSPEEYGYGDGWIRCDKCGAKAFRLTDARSGVRVYSFLCIERTCRRRWSIVDGEVVELGVSVTSLDEE